MLARNAHTASCLITQTHTTPGGSSGDGGAAERPTRASVANRSDVAVDDYDPDNYESEDTCVQSTSYNLTC
jgi:hypothetical protein